MSRRDELRQKLKSEIDVAEWAWVKPHAEQDRVIVVSQDLELLEVAVTVAAGDLPQVESWMKETLLTKPTREQLRTYNSDERRTFQCVIVQPWVLIQAQSN